MHTVMWMSYDLGVKGDYEGLYAWLDEHSAAECGNSVAFLRYEYSADFLSELKEDIARHVNLDKRDRIYTRVLPSHAAFGCCSALLCVYS